MFQHRTMQVTSYYFKNERTPVTKCVRAIMATRRRIRKSAISVFLAVLMLVSPEALAQLHNEAMAYQAMTEGSVAVEEIGSAEGREYWWHDDKEQSMWLANLLMDIWADCFA